MKVVIDIPKDFTGDYIADKFKDFFSRVIADIDCKGCKYENSTDIEICLEFCTDCKRAYSNEEDREFHEDKYEIVG